MPGTHRPPAVAETAVVQFLEEEGYTTESLLRAERAPMSKAGEVRAAALLDAFMGRAGARPDPQDVWQFAHAMAFLAGAEPAREAARRALDRQAGPGALAVLLLIAQALGALPDTPAIAMVSGHPSRGAEAPVRKALAGLGTGEHAALQMVQLLYVTPGEGRPALAALMLQVLKVPADRQTLAAIGVLSPLGATTHARLIELLAGAGEAGRAFLAALTPDEAAPEVLALARRALMRHGVPQNGKAGPLRGVPLTWSVESAYASFPDGRGSQGLYLFRQRPDGRHALVGGVYNELRGIADGIASAAMTTAERDAFCETQATAGLPLVPVEPGYVVSRLRAGEAIARAKGLPLPFDYTLDRYLLAGLTADDAPDLEARAAQLEDKRWLPFSGALLATHALGNFFFVDDGTEGTDTFFAMATGYLAGLRRGKPPKPRRLVLPEPLRVELDAPYGYPLTEQRLAPLVLLGSRHLKQVFARATRTLWRDRLLQAMHLFEREGRSTLAAVAATAARALATSVDFGFTREVLVVSALRATPGYDLVPLAGPPPQPHPSGLSMSEVLFDVGAPLFSLLPDDVDPPTFLTAAQIVAATWNAGLEGAPAPPEARRLFKQLNRQLALPAPLLDRLLSSLTTRQRALYPDLRLRIVKLEAYQGEHEVRLKAYSQACD